MSWEFDGENPLGENKGGIFGVHGNLDGESRDEFQEREQFIGLIIASEEFLLPISSVREIIMLPPITYVPNAPEFVDGVINLRGIILPAINMRKLLGVERGETTSGARIIVARFEDVTFGILVDGITYVVALLPAEIENQSLPGKGSGAEFITAVSKQGNKICGILDLGQVLRQAGGIVTAEDEDAAKPAA